MIERTWREIDDVAWDRAHFLDGYPFPAIVWYALIWLLYWLVLVVLLLTVAVIISVTWLVL